MNKILFKHIDARQYAALRIAFGGFALLTAVGLLPQAIFNFSDDGWFPVRVAMEMANRQEWTLLDSITSAWGVLAFFALLIVACLGMIVGYRSRLCTILVFIGFVSLSSRNWFINYGGDDVLRLMLFYLMLAPVGAAWSIDSWLASPRRDRTGPATAEIWPLRLMQVQVCLIYFTTGLGKLHGQDWIDGSALAVVMQNPVQIKWNFDIVQLWPWLEMPLRIMAWVTMIWEFTFPLLMVVNRWVRWGALLVGVGMHLGIILFLQIHWFGYIMIATYLTFLPDGVFARVEAWGTKVLARYEPRARAVYERLSLATRLRPE